MAYDQEDDPDFEVQDISEESDESSDEEIDEDETEAQTEKGEAEKYEIDDQEIVDLTNLVEEMIIPTEEAPTSAAAAVELDGSEDSSDDNISEDEDAVVNVSVSEIIQEEMVSDDDGEDYKPVENGQESSEDSYESATSGSETDDDDTKMDE